MLVSILSIGVFSREMTTLLQWESCRSLPDDAGAAVDGASHIIDDAVSTAPFVVDSRKRIPHPRLCCRHCCRFPRSLAWPFTRTSSVVRRSCSHSWPNRSQNQYIFDRLPFAEGVCTAPKSPLGKHAELEVPNLYVLKAMQSLHSRNYVSYKFCWQWFYYSLTNEVRAAAHSLHVRC